MSLYSKYIRRRGLAVALVTTFGIAGTASATEEQEPDLELGKQLNRQCALCHGLYSQGILGGKYPAYLSDVDLSEVYPLDVPTPEGADLENGEDLYQSDCKTCHGRKGEGKKSKDSPQVAGQYDGYLLRQIQMFKDKKREHAGDPDDDSFDDYSEQEILDIVGYVTTLDDPQ